LQIAHAELVDLHTSQVTDFDLTDLWLTGNGAHSFIESRFLLLVQFLDRALERRGDEDAHQPNW
jgi:hypothetical protein